jgi:hypothetical protein
MLFVCKVVEILKKMCREIEFTWNWQMIYEQNLKLYWPEYSYHFPSIVYK